MTLCSLTVVIVVVFAAAVGATGDAPSFVAASSIHAGDYLPHYAFDGDSSTRWASAGGNAGDWLRLDLGLEVPVGPVEIVWEHAYARDYEIQVSRNGSDWESVYRQSGGEGGTELAAIPEDVIARYMRLFFNAPGPHGLYSIWTVNFLRQDTANAVHEQMRLFQQEQRERTNESRERLRHALNDAGIREIVYVTRALYDDGHWYANFSYFAGDTNRKTYVQGSGMYILDALTGETRALIEDEDGTLRDPAVHYDGRRILFSWRRGESETFHLYTINSDGTELTQLTDGDYDDIEPAWLPDGGIVFVSSRSRRWVNCWLTQVATIHRCDADGSNVLPLSANLEHDNTPWPLPDGRILYTRWEYVDRSQVDYHHLWTMNPDGTGQMTYFGNMHPPDLYIDAKPIPGTDEVLFINSPGHGAREHVGHVAIVHDRQGPDHLPALRNISRNGFRDPYPITADAFLVAQGRNLVMMDRDGVTEIIHRLPPFPRDRELHEPRPLRPREREPIIPPRVDYSQTTGFLVLADAYLGRNMDGLSPGDIASMLVVESLPKPINYTGGMDPLSYGGTFTLERVLGKAPVEADGSAYIEAPANRSLFFVALDADDNSVKRMQSFLTVMPGETMGCVGCHEERTQTPATIHNAPLQALQRPPSRITPIAAIPDVFDFPRDIQPVLDKHCVGCHDYERHDGYEHGPRAGGAVLTGDRGPMFSHSYATLTVLGQVADGRNRAVSNYPPRALGAGASPLMQKIKDGHHGASLSDREIDYIRYWIETGAAYPGTYGALGAGSIGGYHENEQVETDYDWPETRAAAAAVNNRCVGCHQGDMQLPTALSDENGLSFWRPDWNDPRLKRARHLTFNLSRPALSLMLLAPLAREAGGYGLCRVESESGESASVFTSTDDPDYQAILAMCETGKERLESIGRFDMEGYHPPVPYIREMIRYGVLPPDHHWDAPVDPYALDRAYWASFEQEAALQHPAYATP